MTEYLPNRIREIRTMMDMSQEELGSRIGTSKQQVGRIEIGKVELNLRWMRKIADAFQCTVADLLVEEDNPYRLNDMETELINLFRGLDAAEREKMFRLLVAFCTPANENRAA
jgi:DNA-binding XRE family transcriptional regulator